MSVDVRKPPAAVLARSSREIYQTVRIDCHCFLSHVRTSFRPSNLYRQNPPKRAQKPSIQLIASDMSRRRQLERINIRS